MYLNKERISNSSLLSPQLYTSLITTDVIATIQHCVDQIPQVEREEMMYTFMTIKTGVGS